MRGKLHCRPVRGEHNHRARVRRERETTYWKPPFYRLSQLSILDVPYTNAHGRRTEDGQVSTIRAEGRLGESRLGVHDLASRTTSRCVVYPHVRGSGCYRRHAIAVGSDRNFHAIRRSHFRAPLLRGTVRVVDTNLGALANRKHCSVLV